jgi:hypothetical protein
MSSPPEAIAPMPASEQGAPLAIPEEINFVLVPEEPRSWLRAGVLFGGVLTWATAVFGAMAEHELWTGASAGFGLTLVLVTVYVLSVRSGYRSPAKSVRQVSRRALVTLVVGTVLWMMFVFITLVLCERSSQAAMLVLGVLGMLTAFIVLGLFSRGRARERSDPAIRAVRALAWLTILLVSVTVLVPPLADAMARRAHRPRDGSTTADVADVGDD